MERTISWAVLLILLGTSPTISADTVVADFDERVPEIEIIGEGRYTVATQAERPGTKIGRIDYRLTDDVEKLYNQFHFVVSVESGGPEERYLSFRMKTEGGAGFYLLFEDADQNVWQCNSGSMLGNAGEWIDYTIDLWDVHVKISGGQAEVRTESPHLSADKMRSITFRVMNSYALSGSIYLDDVCLHKEWKLEQSDAIEQVDIRVDAAMQTGTLNPLWRDFSWWNIPVHEGGERVRRRVKREIPVRMIRYHSPVWEDRTWVARDHNDYAYVDEQMDEYLLYRDGNVMVCVELIPEWLAPPYEERVKGWNTWWYPQRKPPTDYGEYERVLAETVRHFEEKYPGRVTHYECWNEPMWPNHWRGTKREFFEMYAHMGRAIKAAAPHVKYGGHANSPGLENLIRYAHENNLPLDFISFHSYTHVPVRYVWQAELFRKLLERYPEFKETELAITEWSAGFHRVEADEYLHTPFLGAFVSTFYKQFNDSQLVDYAHFWDVTSTSLLDPQTQTAYPVFNVVKLFNMLGSRRVEATSSGEEIGVQAIASASDDEVVLLYWWFIPHDADTKRTKTVGIEISDLPFAGPYTYERYVVNSRFSNYRAGNAELVMVEKKELLGKDQTFEFPLELYGVQCIRFLREAE